jgi:predicted acylesterase/phospholipase RssA
MNSPENIAVITPPDVSDDSEINNISSTKRYKTALCLSGGGLRATLFHFGVLAALREANEIDNVSCIFSVSGGSILAAHAVINWDNYSKKLGGDFLKARNDIKNIARYDIRGRVIRRWLFGWSSIILYLLSRKFGRSRLLERQYEYFLTNITFYELYSKKQFDRPDCFMIATSLTRGQPCCFSRHGFSIGSEVLKTEKTGNSRSLAFAVAASSAFPPLFPPVGLSQKMLGSNDEEFPKVDWLTDGGVYDNLAYEMANTMANNGVVKYDRIIISDAGSTFESDRTSSFHSILSRSWRSVDISMSRASAEVLIKTRNAATQVRISDTFGEYIPILQQRRLSKIEQI